MKDEKGYANLIKIAKPDFVEAKGFMSVGFSRQRLGYEHMPRHNEVKNFAKKIAKLTNLKILDEKKESSVVLLGKSKNKMRIRGV
jgi:tRNA wybutosine-synthesizing protein 1